MAHSGRSSAVVVAPKDFTADVRQEHLLPETIYWSNSKTLSIHESKYFDRNTTSSVHLADSS